MGTRIICGFLLGGVLLGSAVAAEPPFGVKNCLRYGAEAACKQPLVRAAYPNLLTKYLFYAAQATFKQQAVLKLRVRRPAKETAYVFDIGDLTQREDSVGTQRGFTDPERETLTVSLQVWHDKNDASARLFALGWLKLWNDELREPFPIRCTLRYDVQERRWKQLHPGCVDLSYMVELVVINAHDHMVRRGEQEE